MGFCAWWRGSHLSLGYPEEWAVLCTHTHTHISAAHPLSILLVSAFPIPGTISPGRLEGLWLL